MFPILIFVGSYFLLSHFWSEMSIFYLLPAPLLVYFLLCFTLSRFFNIEMASVNDVSQAFCETKNAKSRVVVGIIYESKYELDTFLAKLKQRSLLHPFYQRLKKILYVSKMFILFGYWKPCLDFNIDDHYEVFQKDIKNEEYFKLIGDELCSVEFAPNKPKWKIVLIPNLEGDRSALILKIHHSYIDGISGFIYFLNLTDCKNYNFIHLPKINKLQWVFILIMGFFQTFVAYIKCATFRWDRKPFHSGIVSGRKRVSSKEFSLERVKKFTKENNVTINDTMTTLIAMSLKTYYEKQNITLKGNMLAMIPTSLRDLPKPEEHYPLENKSLVLYVKLPMMETLKSENFKEMVHTYHNILNKIKRSYEAYFMKFSLEVMPLFFPPSFIKSLIQYICCKVSILITNVPGPTSKIMSFGKYRVAQIVSTVNIFSDLELAFTVVSFDNKICVNCISDEINKIDPKAVLENLERIIENQVYK